MAEYVVKGAEPNETVLHSWTQNGYEEWSWLPVHERIVRCRDCEHCREHDMRAYGGDRDQLLCNHFSMSSGAGWPVKPNGFCSWGERRESE